MEHLHIVSYQINNKIKYYFKNTFFSTVATYMYSNSLPFDTTIQNLRSC